MLDGVEDGLHLLRRPGRDETGDRDFQLLHFCGGRDFVREQFRLPGVIEKRDDGIVRVVAPAVAELVAIALPEAVAPVLDLWRRDGRDVARARGRETLQVLAQIAEMATVELVVAGQLARVIYRALREEEAQYDVDSAMHGPAQCLHAGGDSLRDRGAHQLGDRGQQASRGLPFGDDRGHVHALLFRCLAGMGVDGAIGRIQFLRARPAGVELNGQGVGDTQSFRVVGVGRTRVFRAPLAEVEASAAVLEFGPGDLDVADFDEVAFAPRFGHR